MILFQRQPPNNDHPPTRHWYNSLFESPAVRNNDNIGSTIRPEACTKLALCYLRLLTLLSAPYLPPHLESVSRRVDSSDQDTWRLSRKQTICNCNCNTIVVKIAKLRELGMNNFNFVIFRRFWYRRCDEDVGWDITRTMKIWTNFANYLSHLFEIYYRKKWAFLRRNKTFYYRKRRIMDLSLNVLLFLQRWFTIQGK